MKPTRLPPISHEALKALYAECVSLGMVWADTEWKPPQVTASELISKIRKDRE